MTEYLIIIREWVAAHPFIGSLSVFLFLIFISFIAFWITKKILLSVLYVFIKRSKTKWDDMLVEKRFFNRLSNLTPAIILYFSAYLIPQYAPLIQKASYVYMILIFLLAFDSFINAANAIYESYEISKERPIKTYLEVVKILVFIIGGIVIIAALINKSPLVILSGLGALMAVVILVFRDTILSFVASIKISSTDILKKGDWIEMPQFDADGDVIDISLNTIRVQNWDKTIVSIPTYKFLEESFKNWRGMQESGGRRIKRSVSIDLQTIKFADDKLKKKLQTIHLLKGIIQKKEDEINQYNLDHKVDTRISVNGRRMTNIGLFRAYIVEYLKHHPMINQSMTFLVRQLAPNSKGLPIEIYVFSKDKVWANYEAIQADLFDHLLAAVRMFDLRVFQEPSGNDFRQILRANTNG